MKLQRFFPSRRAWIVLWLVVLWLVGTSGFSKPAFAKVVVPDDVIESGIPAFDETYKANQEAENNNNPSVLNTVSNNTYGFGGYLLYTILGNPGNSTAQISIPSQNGGIQLPDASSGNKYNKGAIREIGELSAALFANPPARTDLYIADVLRDANIGIASPAYAQGIGFASLSPILNAWKTMRNLAYFFFVIVFLVIGFLIMLRHKVGGQTVVTAQQAVPRVVISLLAVTFSYAVAGLLIDMMYVLMFLLVGVFGNRSGLINLNFLSLTSYLVSSSTSSVYDVVHNFIGAIVGSLPADAQSGLAAVGGFSVSVVVAIAILFGMFKLFFILLKTYVTILLNIVLSPIILMVGAVPGKNVFGSWVKSLIGNLAAFPTTLVVLLIYDELTKGLGGTANQVGNTAGFMPPYLIGTGTADLVVFVLGFGIILIIGDIVKQSQSLFGAGKGPFDALTQNLVDAAKKGITGGELIPGLGITDTRKYGISGKQIVGQALPTVAAGVAGGVSGAVLGGLNIPFRRITKSGYDTPGVLTGVDWAKAAMRGTARRVYDEKDYKKFFERKKEDKK